MQEKIDIFCHWMPGSYAGALEKACGSIPVMMKRAAAMPVMRDLSLRFEIMDRFPGYCQIPSLVSPPFEHFADPDRAARLARTANEAAASLVQDHPRRFLSFVASVPMKPIPALLKEAEYAVRTLGACGVQIFTQINGQPVDGPEYEPFFGLMAEMNRPVWLHPARTADFSDYQKETHSRYEIWWSIGWLYETTTAMIRLSYAGYLEKYQSLAIITHHAGAFIPAAEGRLSAGMEVMDSRTPGHLKPLTAPRSRKPLIENLKRFYTDSATFGSQAAFQSGLAFFGADHMLFASDMPFGPDQGNHHIGTACDIIDRSVERAADRKKIYGANIRRLTGLTSDEN